MSDLNVSLILRLIDQVTAPSRAVINAVQNIGEATERAGRRGVAWSNQQLALNASRRQALQGEALSVAATGYALYQAMRPAVEFETAMAGVRRVVDFDQPDGLAAMQRDILDLTTSDALPMAADGIAAIIEAAGQAGVIDSALPDAAERAAYIEFARDAAQMGTAFDISAASAGESMALWRVTLRMNRDEAMAFGDAINHLSNSMDASAPEIVEMVRRSGAFAQAAGLTETSIVALSAALLAGGAAPQVASTGMQSLLTTMTAGAAATDAQREVWQSLGMDADEMAERMQVDAAGAIYDVMEALASLPEHTQIAALTQLFGRESADAIAPLLGNLGLLEQAFGLVEDPANYAGSMLAEFETQAATTANALRITMNFVNRFAVSIGSILLPELNELFQAIQPVVLLVTEWAAAHPELIQLIARVVLGLLAFRAASIALRWGLLSAMVPLLHMIRGGSWMIAMLPRLGAALLALLNPLAWVRGAVWAIRTAFLASGIGLLLAGIAAAGLWIYNNWDGLKIFFVNLWQAFRDALGPAAPILDGIIEAVERLWNWLIELLGPLDASEDEWAAWGTSVGTVLGNATAAVIAWVTESDGVVSLIAKLMVGWIALRTIWRLPMAPFRLVAKIIGFLLRGPLRLLLNAVKLLGSGFLGFGRLVARAMGGAVSAVADAVRAMNRSFGRIRLPGETSRLALWGSRLLRVGGPLAAFYAGLGITATGNGELSPEDRELAEVPTAPLAGPAATERDVIAMHQVPAGLTPEVEEAMAVVQAARRSGDLPTLERRAELEGLVATLQAEVSDLQGQIDNLGDGPMAEAMAMPLRREMSARTEELAQAEAELAEVQTQAESLTDALLILDETNVEPVIDAVHLQRALTAALELNRTLEGLPQTSGTPSPHPELPGRDAGGPVRAGQPYWVGERGREMFIPGVSGSIVPTRVIRAAMAAASLTAPVAAAADTAFLETALDHRPALSAPAPQSVSTTIEVGQIVINAAPGMDPAQIGREVRRQLQALQDDRRGDLHDGVDF